MSIGLFFIFFIFYLIGVGVTSFTIIPILIILVFGIPTTNKLENLKVLKPNNGIVKGYFISLIILGIVFLAMVMIINSVFPSGLIGILFGGGMVFLFGIGQVGRNEKNIGDYIERNKEHLLMTEGEAKYVILGGDVFMASIEKDKRELIKQLEMSSLRQEKNYKVVLVCSDKFVNDIYQKKLEEIGFDFVSVDHTDKNFVEDMAKLMPDLILMGIIINDVNGIELTKALKSDLRTNFIRVVGFSNLSYKQVIEEGLALGMEDYWNIAQYSPEEIIAKVKQIAPESVS